MHREIECHISKHRSDKCEHFGILFKISPFFFLKMYLFLYCVYECFASLFILHMQYPRKPEEGVGFPETRHRWLWAGMCVLGTEPWSSARTANALNKWAISPAPIFPISYVNNWATHFLCIDTHIYTQIFCAYTCKDTCIKYMRTFF